MKFEFSKKEFDYFCENCLFTDLELEILIFRIRGKYIDQIAVDLNISSRTVNRHVKNIKKKILKCIKETPLS